MHYYFVEGFMKKYNKRLSKLIKASISVEIRRPKEIDVSKLYFRDSVSGSIRSVFLCFSCSLP